MNQILDKSQIFPVDIQQNVRVALQVSKSL